MIGDAREPIDEKCVGQEAEAECAYVHRGYNATFPSIARLVLSWAALPGDLQRRAWEAEQRAKLVHMSQQHCLLHLMAGS